MALEREPGTDVQAWFFSKARATLQTEQYQYGKNPEPSHSDTRGGSVESKIGKKTANNIILFNTRISFQTSGLQTVSFPYNCLV